MFTPHTRKGLAIGFVAGAAIMLFLAGVATLL